MPGPATDRAAALAFERAGDPGAPPLLLAGSLGSTSAMWAPQLAPLARRLDVIAIDHRGHGRSPVPPGPYAIDELGGDVVALMDQLGLDRASFAGLSLGGMVGMWLAIHAPDRIDRLALLSTAPQLPPASAWRERAATVRGAGTVAVIADGVLGRWLTPGYTERRPADAAAIRAMIAATPPEGYAACCAALETLDLSGRLGRIRAPTLVIAGATDPTTPPDPVGRALAAAIPGARMAIVDDAAHLVSFEQPGAVTALLLDHVAGG